MKSSKTLIALAALCAASASSAAPNTDEIVRVSGASAVRGNLALALNNLCTLAGGAMREWISGGNVSTYVCMTPAAAPTLTSGTGGSYASAPASSFVKFSGTDFSEVRLNVAGGSFTSLQTLAGGSDRYVDPALGTVTVVGGLVNAGATGGGVVTEPGIGGYTDIIADGYAGNVLATVPGIADAVANNFSAQAGVAQGFGVAASEPLFQAMFVAQQTSGLLPPAAVCPTPTTANYCVPTISKAEMASIMSSNSFSAAKTLGAQFLAPQLPANTELRYARRVDTSGTHASAINYFLGIGNMTSPLAVFADPSDRTNPLATTAASGCNVGDVRGPLFTNQEVDTAFVASGQIDLCDRKQGNLRTLASPGTSDVRNELNKTTILGGATNYALGVMSLENDQATYRNTANASVPSTWRWLRIQNAHGADTPVPGTNANRAALINGSYDFYYELWAYVQADAAGKNQALIEAINAELLTGPALDGLTVIGSGPGQQPFNRGGRTDTPSAR
jgi:hypothetical protein